MPAMWGLYRCIAVMMVEALWWNETAAGGIGVSRKESRSPDGFWAGKTAAEPTLTLRLQPMMLICPARYALVGHQLLPALGRHAPIHRCGSLHRFKLISSNSHTKRGKRMRKIAVVGIWVALVLGASW